MCRKEEEAKALQEGLNRSWHLATTPLEVDVTELEFSLMRAFEAFGRWQAEADVHPLR